MYTYYTIMSAAHQDAGDSGFKSRFPYHWLKASWYHYLTILNIDYDNGFKCPSCSLEGDEPPLIVCDGTSLACRRELLQELPLDLPPPNYVLDGR